jgi:putative membrane protein
MPSDERLHPLSILFGLAGQVKEFAVPLILLFVTAGSRGGSWEAWTGIFIVPYSLIAIGRYFTFRYTYEPNELVIRSGLIFRNERHIPYARIQNIDAVQNPFHRALGVVDVRIDTGSGGDVDAKLSVVTWAAYEEMRRHVFAERAATSAEAAPETPAAPAAPEQVLLRLGTRDLVLQGLIENRGMVVIAAAFGLLWETGLMDTFTERIVGDDEAGKGFLRDVVAFVWGSGGGLPVGRIALAAGGFIAFLMIVRVFSIAWALVKLHGFQLTRAGEDLRVRFGLFTRVTATIPLRRIQTLTIRSSLLHRLAGRASLRVDTAGGDAGQATASQREWLAPIIRADDVPALVGAILPELEFETVRWLPHHPRAFIREARVRAITAAIVSALSVMLLGWWSLALFALMLLWGLVSARQYVARLGWAATHDSVLFKSGWLRRYVSVARQAKIQAVVLVQSPFDRRTGMARVRVDTAGASNSAHSVDIPYLPRDVAQDLYASLSAEAARTTFRW